MSNNVKVISGIFKGIEGELSGFTMDASKLTKMKITVDSDNIITVNSNQIEKTEEEYLIYITEIGTNKIADRFPPYIVKINGNADAEEYVQIRANEINPKRKSEAEYCYSYPHINYSVTATPLSSVETDFKINGLDINVKTLYDIIAKLI